MSYAEAALVLLLLLLPPLIIFWRMMIYRRAAEPNTPSDRREVFDLQALESYPHRPLNQGGIYHMTMGLRRLEVENWLTVDKSYLTQHGVRSQILANNKHKVLQCLPGSEDACAELLGLIVGYLTDKYPAMFKIIQRDDNTQSISNRATGEAFTLEPPFNGISPLEIAARLVCEDLNVLQKGPDGGAHHLIASATLFPVGWAVQDRIGWPLSRLHGTVPLWETKLASSVERFFSRITAAQPMERSAFFVQVARPGQSLSEILCQLEAGGAVDPWTVRAEEVLLRRERQAFRRLPRAGTVVFSVRTTVTPLTGLGDEDLLGFAKEVSSWPAEVAAYKGRDVWVRCAMEFCKQRLPEGSVEGIVE